MRDRVVEGREYAEVERCLDMDIKRAERARPTDRKSIRQEPPDPCTINGRPLCYFPSALSVLMMTVNIARRPSSRGLQNRL